jgi:hypothetical protein
MTMSSQEEVVVLVKFRAMQCYKRLPLLIFMLIKEPHNTFLHDVIRCCVLMIDFDALSFNHDQAAINTLDFGN